MPYYHKKDNGVIGIWSRKCSKCGKRWPISVWFVYPPPKDMTRYVVESKGPTTYSSWADKVPLVNVIPRLLPNWPRWARLLVTGLVLGLIILIIFWIRGF